MICLDSIKSVVSLLKENSHIMRTHFLLSEVYHQKKKDLIMFTKYCIRFYFYFYTCKLKDLLDFLQVYANPYLLPSNSLLNPYF